MISHHKYSLKIPNITPNPIEKKNDSFLMSDFYPFFSKYELKTINQCRMFLKVITLADIINSSGTFFKPSFIKHPSPQNSNLHWPMIPSPKKHPGEFSQGTTMGLPFRTISHHSVARMDSAEISYSLSESTGTYYKHTIS